MLVSFRQIAAAKRCGREILRHGRALRVRLKMTEGKLKLSE
jgi:hypothetical protein